MKRIKFITVSDFHFADWGQFNKDGRRIKDQLKVWKEIENLCIKYDCPLLFPGDLFHNPKHLSNRLLNMVLPTLVETPIKVIGIDGNHDQDGISTTDKFPYTYMKLLQNLSSSWQSINFDKLWVDHDTTIHGIPYLTHNIGFNEYIENIKLNPGINILLIHTDLPGAVDTSGREVGTAEGISKQYSKLFKKFDLVLAGHIHKPQKLASNVIMVGAPQQQNRGDRNCEFGYWAIYNDLSTEFFKIDSPQFKTTEHIDSTDAYNYWDIQTTKVSNDKTDKVNNKVKTEKEVINSYIKDSGINKNRAKMLKRLINKAKDEH